MKKKIKKNKTTSSSWLHMCKSDNVTLLSLPLTTPFLFIDVFKTLGIRVEYEDKTYCSLQNASML